MNNLKILRIIDRIRKKSGRFFCSNFFFRIIPNNIPLFFNDNALIFLIKDRSINRLFYACSDLDELEPLLQRVDQKLPICCEIPTKCEDINKFQVFQNLFTFDTKFVRMRCNRKQLLLNHVYTKDEISFAEQNDIPFLFEALTNNFSHHSAHFPTQEELLELVLKNEVIVSREENNISAFAIYRVQGKIGNFNQLVSLNRSLSHLRAVLNMCASQMVLHNLVESFLWIDYLHNKRLMQFHSRWGYKKDGLMNYIFISDALKHQLEH